MLKSYSVNDGVWLTYQVFHMVIGAMLLAKPDKLEDRNRKISDKQSACRDIIKEVT